MALHPARELKIRQPKDFKNYGYGAPPPEGEGKGKKGKNPKMPLADEQPQAVVPGYQYVGAPDGQVMLVPLPTPATEGMPLEHHRSSLALENLSWTQTPGGPPGYLDRPARKQQTGPRPNPLIHGGFYNMWYHRVSGDFEYQGKPKRSNKVQDRCNIRRDAGRTKGDSNPNSWICIYFCRGCCNLGGDCTYLHRRPTDYDNDRLDLMHDVFGRERHRENREDMTGVGSFSKDQRTLYVSGLKNVKGINLEEELIKQFGEWGDLENVRVIHSKNIGFVRYRLRAAAEFAKEAMADSSLGNEEVLTVRWANDDPNPTLKTQTAADNEAKGANAVLNKWGSSALWQYTMPTEQAYPNTDPQYEAKLAQFRAESELARQAMAAQTGGEVDPAYAAAPAAGAYDPSVYATYFADAHPEYRHVETEPVAPEQQLIAEVTAEAGHQKRHAEDSGAIPAPGSGVSTKNIAALINARIKKPRSDAPPPAAAASSLAASTHEKKQ